MAGMDNSYHGVFAGLRWACLCGTYLCALSVSFGAEPLAGPMPLVARALAANPGVVAASLRADAAREAVDQARAAWYPRIYTELGVAGTDNPPQAFMMSLNHRSLDMSSPAFDPNNPDDTSNVRFTVGMAYRLWDGGGRGSQVARAAQWADAEYASYEAVRNALSFEVVRAYYHVMRVRAFSEVQQSTVESIESSLAAAKRRLEAGSAVRSDVLNLEVSLADAQEGQIRARNGVELALAALNTAIGGADPVTLEQLPEAALPEAYPEPVEPAAEGCGARPEAAQAAAQVGASREALQAARAARLPHVDLMATVDWDGEDGSDMEQSYLAGVVAHWDLFAGGGVRAGVRQARAQQAAAEAARAELLNRLALEMREARIRQSEALERLSVTSQGVASSAEALRMGQSQYAQGTIRLSDLLVSQVGLTASRTRHVSAYYDYLVARANVKRAGGCFSRIGQADPGGDAGGIEGDHNDE